MADQAVDTRPATIDPDLTLRCAGMRQRACVTCATFSVRCERDEGVQGVLTLFCSGAAQACHDDRVVELKEQLEVEEEDGDRQ